MEPMLQAMPSRPSAYNTEDGSSPKELFFTTVTWICFKDSSNQKFPCQNCIMILEPNFIWGTGPRLTGKYPIQLLSLKML